LISLPYSLTSNYSKACNLAVKLLDILAGNFPNILVNIVYLIFSSGTKFSPASSLLWACYVIIASPSPPPASTIGDMKVLYSVSLDNFSCKKLNTFGPWTPGTKF